VSAVIVSRAADASLQDHLLALGVAIAVHATIIVHVRRRLAELLRAAGRLPAAPAAT
jgi:hypothetical protein